MWLARLISHCCTVEMYNNNVRQDLGKGDLYPKISASNTHISESMIDMHFEMAVHVLSYYACQKSLATQYLMDTCSHCHIYTYRYLLISLLVGLMLNLANLEVSSLTSSATWLMPMILMRFLLHQLSSSILESGLILHFSFTLNQP